MQKHRVSLLKTTTFSTAANIPESAVDSTGQNAIVDKQGTTMLLENSKERRVKSGSKGSITMIEHELSYRGAARGVAIVVVHRDRELLASASRSNRKLSAETWEKQLFSPLALAGIITQNMKRDQKGVL